MVERGTKSGSSDVELWFETAPAPAAIAIALEAFGELHESRDGTLRLVEAGEPIEEGLPLALDEEAAPPAPVRQLAGGARAALRSSAVLTGSRGFQLARMAAELQRRLGGVIYVPSLGEAFPDAAAFEESIPGSCAGQGHLFDATRPVRS